jgi:pimeloyl-ACP methyl ester carboxylesterase
MGLPLDDIRASVHLWHGEQDANHPIAMARYLAAAIPNRRVSFDERLG